MIALTSMLQNNRLKDRRLQFVRAHHVLLLLLKSQS